MNRHHYITRHDILGKSMESNNRGGIRTRNFRIRSPTPYPLGHTITRINHSHNLHNLSIKHKIIHKLTLYH